MKNIFVCMKQVMDPEAPLSLFKIDSEAKQAILPKATPPVLSPFDENALEAALKIKDSQPANVTVISMGKKLTRTVVKAPLAAGADQLILLEDEVFGDFNTFLTASALSAAIRKAGSFDLILCGMVAADTNAGQVGTGIASLLGLPCITAARKVELVNDRVKVERNLPDGTEIVETATPAVVTTSYEVGALREPGVEAFMSANKKPITIWKAADLGIDASKTVRTKFTRMYQPVRDTKCEIIQGSSPDEQAQKIVSKLKEAKVI